MQSSPKSKKYVEDENAYVAFCEKIVEVILNRDAASGAGARRVKVTKPDGTFEYKDEEDPEDDLIYKRPVVVDRAKLDKAATRFVTKVIPPKKKPAIDKINDLFTDNFHVGEIHNEIQAKKFLIENMESLKQSGHEFLFMEHLFYDHQADLDDYYLTGKMPDRLAKRLQQLDNEWGTIADKELWKQYNFTNVVVAAQKAGIRIVAIDTEGSYATQGKMMSHESDNRMAIGNYTFAHIMAREVPKLPPGKKYCTLIGSGHCRQYKIGNNKIIPGVADISGARALYINNDKSQEILLNKNFNLQEGQDVTVLADMLINAPERASLKFDDLSKFKTTVVAEAKVEAKEAEPDLRQQGEKRKIEAISPDKLFSHSGELQPKDEKSTQKKQHLSGPGASRKG